MRRMSITRCSLQSVKTYVLPQEGEIYFSVKDLENMPVGFGKEIEEIALAKGGKLTVAGAGRDNIDNGFILAYGGIEENCTIRAMFDANGMNLRTSFTGCSLYDMEGERE